MDNDVAGIVRFGRPRDNRLSFIRFAAEQDFFAGLDVSGGAAFGPSRTTNGGAPFAGGGVVGNVKLGEVVGVGAM